MADSPLLSLFVLTAALALCVIAAIAGACCIKFVVSLMNRPPCPPRTVNRPKSPYRLEITRDDGSKNHVCVHMTWREATHCRDKLLEIGMFAQVEITHDPTSSANA